MDKSQEIVLVERFDQQKLRYILDNWDSLSLRDETRYGTDGWSPRAILLDYMQKSKNGTITVRYKQNCGSGRYFAVRRRSQQSMPREIRHTSTKNVVVW